MVEKIIKVPEGLADMQTFLELDGLTVVEACLFNEHRKGSMFLQDHLLLFVLNGKYTVRFGGEEHIVRKNEMVLLQKAIAVEYDKTGEGKDIRLDYMQFFLKDDLINEFFKLSKIKADRAVHPRPISVYRVDQRLLKYIESLKPYFAESERIEKELIRIKLLELLFGLTSAHESLMSQFLLLKQPAPTNIPEIMEKNLMNPVSIEDLAYLSGRSLSSFKRHFKEIYNMPPAQWMREKRLDKARELLANSSLSVTEICTFTGFENFSHFSRAFKKRFGYPPSNLKAKVSKASK